MLGLTPIRAIWSIGNTPKLGWNWGEAMNTKICNISETVQDRTTFNTMMEEVCTEVQVLKLLLLTVVVVSIHCYVIVTFALAKHEWRWCLHILSSGHVVKYWE